MNNIISSSFDPEVQPKHLDKAYKSTLLRAPSKPLIIAKKSLSDSTGPLFEDFNLGELDHDLTKNSIKISEPLGERIVVHGRVTDEKGQPIPHTLVEIWQANAAGRYVHKVDQHNAPIDPNFLGTGRCLTDAQGNYKFYTIKPGAYPWGNHHNAWRPAHISWCADLANVTLRGLRQNDLISRFLGLR